MQDRTSELERGGCFTSLEGIGDCSKILPFFCSTSRTSERSTVCPGPSHKTAVNVNNGEDTIYEVCMALLLRLEQEGLTGLPANLAFSSASMASSWMLPVRSVQTAPRPVTSQILSNALTPSAHDSAGL